MTCICLGRSRGFTLVELAISLLIIGLILGAVLTQTNLLGTGNAIHVSSVVQDLVKMAGEFRNRYKFLPGDFPATTSDLPNVLAACTTGNSNAGNGNGVIDAAETVCVGEHLFRAGLARSSAIATKYGSVRIVARASGLVAGHSGSVLNVIELCAIPQDVASEVDAKIDDGNLAGGTVLWTAAAVAAWCTGGTSAVPLMSVALR